MLTREAKGHLPATPILKGKIVRNPARKWKLMENGVSASELPSYFPQVAGRRVRNGCAPWRSVHCPALTTHWASFPGRKLPTRQGPCRAAFHCSGAAKNSHWHPATSLKESLHRPSTAGPRPAIITPVVFLLDPQPPHPAPPQHPLGRPQRRSTPVCVPCGCHADLFSSVTLTFVDWL